MDQTKKQYASNRKTMEAFNGCGFTLDGRIARVCGTRRDAGTVYTDDDEPMMAHDWAWPTLARMIRGGNRTLFT